MPRSQTPLRRTPIKAKRATPRRRPVPTWDRDDWEFWNLILMGRAGHACERCGKTDSTLERHHRKRRRDGGESAPQILVLCRLCHSWSHEHPALARRYGYIVSVTMEPVTVPVLWRSREWVLLTEDGGRVPAFDVTDAHQ